MGLLSDIKQKAVAPTPATPKPILDLSSSSSGATDLTTPKLVAPKDSTVGTIKSIFNFGKEVVKGGDETTGGIARNTVLGLPKAFVTVGKGLLTGIKDQVMHPDDEQKRYEEQMLPYASPKTTPIKVLTAPGVATARVVSRLLNPGLRPFADDLAQIYEVNRKGGFADQVASGKLPVSFLDELAVLHKTDPQVVGDVAQAVLTAYAGSEAPATLAESKGVGLLSSLSKGFVKGLPIGEAFGAAQAASSGSTNPLEIAGTIGTSGFAGGILGAITSGAIPVSEEILGKVKEAKAAYDAMSPEEKQAGFAKNPLAIEGPESSKGGEIFDTLESLKNKSNEGNTAKEFDPDSYVEEQTKKLEMAQNVGKSGVVGKVSDFFKNAKSKLVDFTAPIEDTLADAVSKNNIKLLPEDDIHNQIDRALRSPTLAGQFAKDNGIVDVIKEAPDLKKLDQYLIAKHALELDARGVETGRDIVKDNALVKALSAEYEAHAQKISAYSGKLLDYSVETGLISKELADALKKKYPDYVPFSRVFSELEKSQGYSSGGGVASLSKQTIIRKIEGSEREIESPIHSLLAKTNEAFKQGEKNVAGKVLASYKDLPGNPFQLKEITGEEIGGRNTITFFDEGKKRVFETTKEIAEAAKSLNVQQLNILGKIFAFPVRVARIGITGINLPFVGANIAKDAVTAFINSKYGLKSSIANPANFVRALFSAVAHDKLYEDMVRAGGAGTSFDLARNQTESTVKGIRAGRNVGTKILYTVTRPHELLRAVEDIVGRSEEFTRLQQFSATKKAELKGGATEKSATTEAARQARDATVNFARRGEWGTVLNSAFLYLNAGIQGTRTLLRNLKDRPVQTTTKIAVSALFPMAVATAWNLNDPERKKAYDDIAPYEKENNIIIVPPHPTKDAQGKWNVIKIPLSQEIAHLTGTSRRAVEMAYGEDPLGFGDFADAVIGTVSPIAPNKGDVLSSITPQAIRPTIEAAANTKLFTGIPQVPQSMANLSPENQVKPYTSGTAIQIGEKLGVSPIKVEEFIKGTFGGVGSQALNVTDRVLNGVGVIPKDQVNGQDILDAIAARFNKAQGGAGDDKAISEVQDLLKKQADSSNALKKQAEKLDAEFQKLPPAEVKLRFDQIAKENPELAKKLGDVVQERKLGLSYQEKIMMNLGVVNGERAKYINEEIMKLKTPAERKAYFTDLVNKKVITANVAAQISSLNKK